MKCFSELRRRLGLHSANASDRFEQLGLIPVTAFLRGKKVRDDLLFLGHDFRRDADERIGLTKVTVIFWNFIFQNEPATKQGVTQFTHDSMILVGVVSVMRENQVRLNVGELFVKESLDRSILFGKESVREGLRDDVFARDIRQDVFSASRRFYTAGFITTQDDPIDVNVTSPLDDSHQGTDAPDLNVVTMSCETNDMLDGLKINHRGIPF